MTALSAALSLQDKAQEYGAYAGIAAVFGLGILSLLYFAQAREVKRLREWAGRAPERAAELEARVTAEAEERRAGAPEPAPAAAAAAGNGAPAPAAVPVPAEAVPLPGVPASAPGDPAPMPGVPASLPTVAAAAATAAGARGAVTGAPGGPGGGVPSSIAGGATATLPPPDVPPVPVAVGPSEGDGPVARGIAPAVAPATDAAAPINGTPTAAPETADRAGADGGTGTAAPPAPATPPATAAARAQGAAGPRPAAVRAGSPQATVPPRTVAGATRAPGGASDGRSRRTLLAVAGAALLAVVGIVLAVVLIGGGGGSEPAVAPNTVAPVPAVSSPANATGAGRQSAAGGARVNRSQVTVAVLNGTTFTGLARSASDKLTKAGFKPGVVTNDTTNQTRSATAIFYGSGQRQAALDVARIIGIGRDAVQPLDPSTRALATEDADVVVSVGADQAR